MVCCEGAADAGAATPAPAMTADSSTAAPSLFMFCSLEEVFLENSNTVSIGMLLTVKLSNNGGVRESCGKVVTVLG